MVKLIQNIPSANDGEQLKDNDNSITQYLGSNKDKILHLAEKHYESLVDTLTNNAMDTAAISSSSQVIAAAVIIHVPKPIYSKWYIQNRRRVRNL